MAMRYISTRGGIEPVSFQDAVMMGLSTDGGLLLPERIPQVSERLEAWKRCSYVDLALEIMMLYADLPKSDLADIVKSSYATFRHPDVTPVVRVGDLHILELFHGPTLAFKDVALQLLGRLFEHILRKSGGHMNILGATSGDTGSAAIHGVRGRKGIRIFVMHPKGRVSRVQELQMTSVLDDNVFNIAVDGTFDDCQETMKTIFRDLPFKERFHLGSINSINWARVLAQIVYYFYGAFRVMERTGASAVQIAVPTGNFGDIFAGYLAARMGLPVLRLILATNRNDILARFFSSGDYSRRDVHETLSPSMDIQIASNFERYLYYRVGEDSRRLGAVMKRFSEEGRIDVGDLAGKAGEELIVAGGASDEQTLETIRSVYAEHGYLMDPHTAVGVHVARRCRASGDPTMCLATAHPAKFGDAIRAALGREEGHHPLIDALQSLPVRCDRLPASAEAVKAYIETKASDA